MYNTGNPLGSTSPKDFSDNSEISDRYVNDVVNETTLDRFGRSRLTIHGQQENARRSFEQFESSAANVIANLGFFPPVDYTDGLNVDSRNFTTTYNGVVYAAQPSAVPFTTGAWDAAQWYPIQNLLNQKNLLVFDTYAEASAAAATLPEGQQLDVEQDLKRYTVLSGGLQFVRNLEELRYDLEENTGAGLVGFDRTLQFNQETVGSAVKEAVGALTYVERFRATGMTDTQVLEAAVAYAEAKTETTTWPYKATTLWLENRVYEIDRPLLMTKALRFDGDRAEIKPSSTFAPITVAKAGGGTELVYALMVFLSGSKGSLTDVIQWSASVGRGIVLNCNEVAKPGLYIERMSYSSINCEVQGSPDHGIEIGPYCWGINLDEVTIENFTNDAIYFHPHAAANGMSIRNPKIWGEFKTGRSGLNFAEDSECNGVILGGGFIEKVLYGVLGNPGGIGQMTIGGTDFEQCLYQVIRVVGGTKRKPQIIVQSSFLHSIWSTKIYASNAKVNVNNCRMFGESDDFETANLGIIKSENNEFYLGAMNIVPGSTVIYGTDGVYGKFLRNYVPQKAGGFQDAYINTNYSFGDAPFLQSSGQLFRHSYVGGASLQYVGESYWYTSEYLHANTTQTVIGVALGDELSGRVFRPMSDGNLSCGSASARWTQVYAFNATINTSDVREKQQIRQLNDAEKAVAIRLKSLIRAFKWNHAVEEKYDGARIHVGVIAQDVVEAFAEEGLDASHYGILCYDKWEASEAVTKDDGAVLVPAKEAGDRYGVRYEELMAFIISTL